MPNSSAYQRLTTISIFAVVESLIVCGVKRCLRRRVASFFSSDRSSLSWSMLSHPQSLTDFLMVGPNLGAVPDGFGCKGGSGTRTQCSRANRLTAQAAHRIQVERTKARAALAAEDSSRRCARWATETQDQAEQEMYADMAKAWTNIALVEADVLRLTRKENNYKRLKPALHF